MSFCRNCGAQLDDGQLFCPACGTAVDPAAAPNVDPAAEAAKVQDNDNLITIFKRVVFQNYANFQGRARRREYWMFVLANVIIGVILGVLNGIFADPYSRVSVFNALSYIYSLAILLPSLGASVRRLHDLDKSGWFVLFAFIPIADIILIVWLATAGTVGPNKYGPDPKPIH